ncbi:MAG: ATP-binding cassette domain-containing protein [Deltaproteobacteria bacterium]|jgi:phospholipid/cholesterol/gamma-HCH transport system ATP-binding protein|nr:ATP-binding cassette domain-containing protein [Deltaproteobacteria bacterium]
MAAAAKISPIPVVQLEDLSLSFGEKVIIQKLFLKLLPDVKLALLGESSCGKTTILKIIVGLITPDHGTVRLFGEDMATLPTRKKEKLRRRVGMQFQAGALFDSLSVRENLSLASAESSRGMGNRAHKASEEEILDILSKVGLENAVNKNPSSLSGGMRKRAAIARALIVHPQLAIFDEPTAGLDPLTSSSIIHLLNGLYQDLHGTMLLCTTDVDVARRFSDDIAIMHEGNISSRGSYEDHLKSTDPYVKRFMARSVKL